MMKGQFAAYPISSVMILGIAGGNGLEHIQKDKYKAELVIANLLIEYIGYECFQKAVQHVNPKYVSCIIQMNVEDTWVSDSPYLHVFDGLDRVHRQMEEQALERIMLEIDYHVIKTLEHMLPNGKKLVQLDFQK